MPAGGARSGGEAEHVAGADVAEHVEEPRPKVVRSRSLEEAPAGGTDDVPEEGLRAVVLFRSRPRRRRSLQVLRAASITSAAPSQLMLSSPSLKTTTAVRRALGSVDRRAV